MLLQYDASEDGVNFDLDGWKLSVRYTEADLGIWSMVDELIDGWVERTFQSTDYWDDVPDSMKKIVRTSHDRFFGPKGHYKTAPWSEEVFVGH